MALRVQWQNICKSSSKPSSSPLPSPSLQQVLDGLKSPIPQQVKQLGSHFVPAAAHQQYASHCSHDGVITRGGTDLATPAVQPPGTDLSLHNGNVICVSTSVNMNRDRYQEVEEGIITVG